MNGKYLYIFLQSNFLEVLFLLFWWRRDLGAADLIWRVTLANSLTHPLVFLFLMRLQWSYLIAILVAETFAVVVEAYLYQHLCGLTAKKAWSGALLANLISWQTAPVLTALIFLRDRLNGVQ